MPIETSTQENGIGTIIDCSGVVDAEELVAAFNQLFNRNAEFQQYTYLILDFSGVTKMNLKDETADTIAKLCAAAEHINSNLIVAVVAYFSMFVSIDMVKRLGGLYEVFQHRSGWDSRVFRTRPEARRWLRKRADAHASQV